jgi:hypothetical protein
MLSNMKDGTWRTLSKAATQNVTNFATLATDDTLFFAMAASAKYRIRGVVFFDTTVAGDFKYAFTAPASPTLVRGERVDCAAGATPAARVIDTATPGSTSLTSGIASNGGFVRFDIVFHNGSNAGTFGFQWAQDTKTADAGANVLAGSYMEIGQA